MKRPRVFPLIAALIAVFLLGPVGAAYAADTTLTTPSGRPVAWADWVRDNAPVAVLLWASWVPDADAALADMDRVRAAVREHGLELMVVVVQEPIKDANKSLDGVSFTWFHDRYGHLLKDYRVVAIPRLLILGEDGRVVARLELDDESLNAWGGG